MSQQKAAAHPVDPGFLPAEGLSKSAELTLYRLEAGRFASRLKARLKTEKRIRPLLAIRSADPDVSALSKQRFPKCHACRDVLEVIA